MKLGIFQFLVQLTHRIVEQKNLLTIFDPNTSFIKILILALLDYLSVPILA